MHGILLYCRNAEYTRRVIMLFRKEDQKKNGDKKGRRSKRSENNRTRDRKPMTSDFTTGQIDHSGYFRTTGPVS